jgi:hypothetical protein
MIIITKTNLNLNYKLSLNELHLLFCNIGYYCNFSFSLTLVFEGKRKLFIRVDKEYYKGYVLKRNMTRDMMFQTSLPKKKPF